MCRGEGGKRKRGAGRMPAHVEVRGQVAGIGSLLTLCRIPVTELRPLGLGTGASTIESSSWPWIDSGRRGQCYAYVSDRKPLAR